MGRDSNNYTYNYVIKHTWYYIIIIIIVRIRYIYGDGLVLDESALFS